MYAIRSYYDHVLTDTGAGIQVVYSFTAVESSSPVDLHVHGYFGEAPGIPATACLIRAYNFTSGAWETSYNFV